MPLFLFQMYTSRETGVIFLTQDLDIDLACVALNLQKFQISSGNLDFKDSAAYE